MKNNISIALSIDPSGKVKLLAGSEDADVAIKAYDEHDGDAILLIRPAAHRIRKAAANVVIRQEVAEDPQPEPDALDEIEGDGEGESLPDIEETEALKQLAKGDKRRGDVKDAIARLAELGVEI